jgi:hypothetical protein
VAGAVVTAGVVEGATGGSVVVATVLLAAGGAVATTAGACTTGADTGSGFFGAADAVTGGAGFAAGVDATFAGALTGGGSAFFGAIDAVTGGTGFATGFVAAFAGAVATLAGAATTGAGATFFGAVVAATRGAVAFGARAVCVAFEMDGFDAGGLLAVFGALDVTCFVATRAGVLPDDGRAGVLAVMGAGPLTPVPFAASRTRNLFVSSVG